MFAPAREAHLSAFRDHASADPPDPSGPLAPAAAPAPHLSPDPGPARPVFPELSLVERIQLLRDDPRVLAAGVAVLALLAGIVFYRSASASGPEREAVGVEAPTTIGSTAPHELVVHVSGAVGAPGVYRVPPGTRAGEAVDAAGGAVGGADLDRLNLAAPVADGQRVHVPRIGEPMPAGVTEAGGAGEDGGPISLNLANAEQLEELPGVGPALAEAIVAERQRRGGYRSVDDLLDVEGIGEKRLADLRSLVTV